MKAGVCVADYAHLAIHVLPLLEYSGALLHRISRRHRHDAPYGPMDFAGWFEAYLGGRWYTFDARNNIPRIGRVLIALGRDAADVPMTYTFGPNTLVSFRVWTDEVTTVTGPAPSCRPRSLPPGCAAGNGTRPPSGLASTASNTGFPERRTRWEAKRTRRRAERRYCYARVC